MKQNIMKRAWEIRKAAANNFGCKVSEIEFSECLREAWAEIKNPPKNEEKKMNTFASLEDARAAKTNKVVSIIEIEHKTAGRCFTMWTANMDTVKLALKRSPMPEIIKLIKEYDPMTPEELSAYKAGLDAKYGKCTRCGAAHGPSTVSVKGLPYCGGCARLLGIMADGQIKSDSVKEHAYKTDY